MGQSQLHFYLILFQLNRAPRGSKHSVKNLERGPTQVVNVINERKDEVRATVMDKRKLW